MPVKQHDPGTFLFHLRILKCLANVECCEHHSWPVIISCNWKSEPSKPLLSHTMANSISFEKTQIQFPLAGNINWSVKYCQDSFHTNQISLPSTTSLLLFTSRRLWRDHYSCDQLTILLSIDDSGGLWRSTSIKLYSMLELYRTSPKDFNHGCHGRFAIGTLISREILSAPLIFAFICQCYHPSWGDVWYTPIVHGINTALTISTTHWYVFIRS